MYPELESFISGLPHPATERQALLFDFGAWIKNEITTRHAASLVFVCTHNSRRSQFAQVWAHTLARYYSLSVDACSAGVEVTACHPNTIAALLRCGFTHSVSAVEGDNPKILLSAGDGEAPIALYSKLVTDVVSVGDSCAAAMTCADAEENCPFVQGVVARFPLRYEDPKKFDNTPEESKAYDARCVQIASELNYVFREISRQLRG